MRRHALPEAGSSRCSVVRHCQKPSAQQTPRIQDDKLLELRLDSHIATLRNETQALRLALQSLKAGSSSPATPLQPHRDSPSLQNAKRDLEHSATPPHDSTLLDALVPSTAASAGDTWRSEARGDCAECSLQVRDSDVPDPGMPYASQHGTAAIKLAPASDSASSPQLPAPLDPEVTEGAWMQAHVHDSHYSFDWEDEGSWDPEGDEADREGEGQEEEELLVDDWEAMDLIFVSAEVAPFSKTGGLGDVMGALPKALAARGHRVMVVTPRYLSAETAKLYAGASDTGVTKLLDLGQGGLHTVGFWHMHSDSVDWVFVDHVAFHRSGNPYGNEHGPYQDNLFRFALLSLASVEASLLLHVGGYRYEDQPGQPYGQRCLFIANDWHAALVPVYLGARFRPHGVHQQSRCVLALHNLAHQGSYPTTQFSGLGLPQDWYNAMEWVVNAATGQGPMTATRTINVLKAGLVTCDKIVTVSQNYAAEVCDLKGTLGMGLSSLLQGRADQLRGIVNGVDVVEWDPANDPHLAPNAYTAASLEVKALIKQQLQVELRLPPESERPMVGFIGRLDYQKGPDLVLAAMPYLISLGCQVVVLGSGAQDYEAAMKQAQLDYPYFVRCITKFDVPLSHRIIASCDILMMPSRFEPCGLNQLFAMRYGTIPVAHSTGGLRDTIDDYNTFADPGSRDRGTGWTFSPASLEAFVDALTAAIKVLQEQPGEWRALQRRAMQQDLSWGKAARQYEIVYAGVMRQQQEKRADLEAKGSQALARQEAQLKLEAAEAEQAAAAAKKAEAEAKVAAQKEAARAEAARTAAAAVAAQAKTAQPNPQQDASDNGAMARQHAMQSNWAPTGPDFQQRVAGPSRTHQQQGLAVGAGAGAGSR